MQARAGVSFLTSPHSVKRTGGEEILKDGDGEFKIVFGDRGGGGGEEGGVRAIHSSHTIT
jgi:hypothetical protein